MVKVLNIPLKHLLRKVYIPFFYRLFLQIPPKSCLYLTIFTVVFFAKLGTAACINIDSSYTNKQAIYSNYAWNQFLGDHAKQLLYSKDIKEYTVHEIHILQLYFDKLLSKRTFHKVIFVIDSLQTDSLISNKIRIVLAYNKAKAYQLNNEYANSESVLIQVIKDAMKHDAKDILYNSYYMQGINHYHKGSYAHSIAYFMKSNEYYNHQSSYYFDSFIKTSLALYRLGNIDSALYYSNPELPGFIRYSSDPKFNLMKSKMLQMRSFYYRIKAKQSTDKAQLLKKSVADCEQAVFHINKHVPQLYYESDQLIFNQRYNYYFYKTIEACERLYEVLPSDSLLFKAFYYAELDKNLALLRTFQKDEIRVDLNLAPKRIKAIDSLRIVYLKHEEEINLLKLDSTANDSLFLQAYNKKGMLMEALQQAEHNLETTYPEYKKQKNSLPKFDRPFLEELSYQKQIIEYVLSDEKVYCFLVSQGKIHTHSFTLNDSLFIKIEQFRHLINGDCITFSDADFEHYQKIAYYLYVQLIAPFNAFLNKNPLLIIPDNELNLIPFEALLTEPGLQPEMDYSQLPYLLNKFDVSYAQSVLIQQHQSKAVNRVDHPKKILAYAPEYAALYGNLGKQYLALRGVRDKLVTLKGAIRETKAISKRLVTHLKLSSQATEQSFKRDASKYAVVHCAMHSVLDNEQPIFSKLVFTPNADTLDDGLLNAWEISNLQLNSQLVVLSACNTGLGKLNTGEGLLSISRSFVYAGCKSILSTLWPVSDNFSAHLILKFYNELKKGNSKSHSLSEAKRAYISNNPGTASHPFYWSGYIISGNDKPLTLKANNNRYIVLFTALVTLCILLYLAWYRKSSKS